VEHLPRLLVQRQAPEQVLDAGVDRQIGIEKRERNRSCSAGAGVGVGVGVGAGVAGIVAAGAGGGGLMPCLRRSSSISRMNPSTSLRFGLGRFGTSARY
jgi:hypothetical protein